MSDGKPNILILWGDHVGSVLEKLKAGLTIS